MEGDGFSVRLSDAATHLMLALIFLLHVDTGAYPLLMDVAYVFSLVLVLTSVATIGYVAVGLLVGR